MLTFPAESVSLHIDRRYMYYNEFKSPALVKFGSGILRNIHDIILEAHFYFRNKILVTQEALYGQYRALFGSDAFTDVVLVQGGAVSEAPALIDRLKAMDAMAIAFGGGSVIDLVKYAATRSETPYVTVPSALSNDAFYSSVARLVSGGKKRSYAVLPPVGIIVDLDVVRQAPVELQLAGVGDLVSNLSAVKDWYLASRETGEKINELAYMLARMAPLPMFSYSADDCLQDSFLIDLAGGLLTSGLSMMACGSSRGASGSEHLISHAIDEYFPERATIHGLQVAWAHLMIEKHCRRDEAAYGRLSGFFERIGVLNAIRENVTWTDEDFLRLIPLARTIRNRYTIFDSPTFQREG